MSRHLRQVFWITLSALLFGLPIYANAAEAPGALTVIVKDQHTDRPLSSVQITITQRDTSATQILTTDAQGRVNAVQLDPGLYSVSLAKSGFSSVYEPSIRVITRKNIKIAFELKPQAIEVVEVRAQQAATFASGSSTYLDREALRSAVGGGADPLLSLDGLPGDRKSTRLELQSR